MNPVNRAQVTAFADSQSLTGRAETELFEVYCAYSVLSGLLSESVDPLDVHLKGAEFGLDGLAILVNGTLITDAATAKDTLADLRNPTVEFTFLQAKTSPSFDYGEISKFFDAVQGFFSGEMKRESDQLDDLIAAKDVIYGNPLSRRNPGIRLFFCALGSYSRPQRIEKLIASTKRKLSALNIFDASAIEITMVGADALQRFYRAASSAIEARFHFPRNVVLPANPSVDEAYLGYLQADQVIKLVTLPGEGDERSEVNKAVFFDNIRDYDENSKINAEVMRTLESGEGSDFVFRNNGITVVAKSIHRVGDDFRIEDFQVVNGCQTSNVLFRSREHLDGVFVPFRLIGSKSDDFIASIIVGTNRQNPVRDEQFWALRPFMRHLRSIVAPWIRIVVSTLKDERANTEAKPWRKLGSYNRQF